MSKKLILVSHRGLATGMKNALSMICGNIDDVKTVELLPEEDGSLFLEKFTACIADNEDEIFVFADLMGGSPCNNVVQAVINYENIHVISGMNLAAVLTCYLQNASIEQILEAGKTNLMDVKSYLSNQEMEDEE